MACDSGAGSSLLTGEMWPVDIDELLEQHRQHHPLQLLDARAVGATTTVLGAVLVPRRDHDAPPTQQLGAVGRGTDDAGPGEEARGNESLRKDALGRSCSCNGSCASQLLRLASGLYGPVECAGLLVHLDRGHGITASLPDVMDGGLPRELHYVAADFAVGDDGRRRPLLALQIAPVSTRVPIKWPMDTLQNQSWISYMPMLSQPNSELAGSELDSQPPILPLTTNIIVDSHDAKRQHIDPCSKSNVQSQQLTPIFVRHVSGELVFSVNLEQSSDHLMQLYANKTKTKLESQYFVYGRKILEPHDSLMFYGVERDTTVHVCTRLLGGLMTISEFIINHRDELVIEVTLPNGSVSLKMTKLGCLFLSTWLKCFTRAFADSKSWNGGFTLNDFRVVNGHVLVIHSAKKRLDKLSMHADLKKLVTYIKAIFSKDKSYLISKFPPYLENLINFLLNLMYPVLLDKDRLFIETHICCVESAARGILLIMLRRKEKSLDARAQHNLIEAMEQLKGKENAYVDFSKLAGTALFDDIIAHATKRKESYGRSRHSTFRLMRDGIMHGPSKRLVKTSKPWTEKFKNDDGIELMIPAYNPNLVPDIIRRWIYEESIDITPELLAAQVRCTCVICHPARSGHEGGEASSSSAGKGKQPESPGCSQPPTPSSSQGPSSYAGHKGGGASSSSAGKGKQPESPGCSQPPTTSSSQRSSSYADTLRGPRPLAPAPPQPAVPRSMWSVPRSPAAAQPAAPPRSLPFGPRGPATGHPAAPRPLAPAYPAAPRPRAPAHPAASRPRAPAHPAAPRPLAPAHPAAPRPRAPAHPAAPRPRAPAHPAAPRPLAPGHPAPAPDLDDWETVTRKGKGKR